MVLQAVQHNPDYHVYKSQSDFKDKVKALAEKQLKEAIIIDAIAYQEGISVSDEDVRAYLNLLKRPRMKDFMYFTLPEPKMQGQEVPLSAEFIKRYCLREKTLNHLIKEVTKKARA
jgi:FKBP-type peptidyl-prolyl cis-trans isomerase (trigger factor)